MSRIAYDKINFHDNLIEKEGYCLLEASKVNFQDFFDLEPSTTDKLFNLLEDSFKLDPNMSYGGARRTYYHHPDEEFIPHKDIYIYLLLSKHPLCCDNPYDTVNVAFMGLKNVYDIANDEHQIHLSHIFVHPEYRKMGIASQMIPFLEKKAKEINPQASLIWTASITNIASQKLALKMGYEKVGEYVSKKTGKPNQNSETIISYKYRKKQ